MTYLDLLEIIAVNTKVNEQLSIILFYPQTEDNLKSVIESSLILVFWFYLLGMPPVKRRARFIPGTGMFKLIAGATEIILSAGEARICVTGLRNSGAVFTNWGTVLLSEALFRGFQNLGAVLKRHVKIYLEYFGYTGDEFIQCEVCGGRAVDIHHIDCRGMGGSKTKDKIENLMAVCRTCHVDYGDKKDFTEYLKSVHHERLKNA